MIAVINASLVGIAILITQTTCSGHGSMERMQTYLRQITILLSCNATTRLSIRKQGPGLAALNKQTAHNFRMLYLRPLESVLSCSAKR